MAFSPHTSIHDLATETIGEIFAAAASDPHCPFNANALPYEVTRVCSRWRSIALDTPALWSNILIDWNVFMTINSLQPDEKKWKKGRKDYLPPPERFSDAAVKMISPLTVWGKRTGRATLDLTFTLPAGVFDGMPTAMRVLGGIFLRPLLPRLRSLKIVSCYEILEELMVDDTLRLPRLRDLEVDLIWGWPEYGMLRMKIEAPRLQHLSIPVSIREQPYDTKTFPWSQLTSLKLCLHPESLRNQLLCLRSAAPTIEELDLSYSEARDTYHYPELPADLSGITITFARLRTLVVSVCGGLGDELDTFASMPLLKEFRLDVKRVGTVHWDKLARFFRRSNSGPEWFYLDITGVDRCSKADLRSLLREMSAVKRFSFRCEREKRMETMVELLACGCGKMKRNLLVLPNMTGLEILGHEPELTTSIVEMVDARLEAADTHTNQTAKIPVASINCLAFRERSDGQHRKMRKAITRWIERGVSVSMELDTAERSGRFG